MGIIRNPLNDFQRLLDHLIALVVSVLTEQPWAASFIDLRVTMPPGEIRLTGD